MLRHTSADAATSDRPSEIERERERESERNRDAEGKLAMFVSSLVLSNLFRQMGVELAFEDRCGASSEDVSAWRPPAPSPSRSSSLDTL